MKDAAGAPEEAPYFIRTETSPVPEGAEPFWFAADDGARLRAAWLPAEAPRGCVVLLGGRVEFIEKYFETAEAFRDRCYDVAMMDWRGQGLSARLLKDPRPGHIDDFDTFADDLAAFLARFVRPRATGPVILVAHSMGGMAALHAMRTRDLDVAAAILSAPMTRLFSSAALRAFARAYAGGACAAGFSKARIVGVPDYSSAFEGNKLTHDRTRHQRFAELQAAAPQAVIGAPTYGWLDASLRANAAARKRGALKAATTPTLILSAAEDALVDSTSHAPIAKRLPDGRCVRIEGAYHEIFMETDDLRAEVWAAIDAFLKEQDL